MALVCLPNFPGDKLNNYMIMNEKAKLSDTGLFGYVKVLLRGAGQVMFQCNAWTGLLFIVGMVLQPQ